MVLKRFVWKRVLFQPFFCCCRSAEKPEKRCGGGNGNETPVGQVRYDLKGHEAVVSVSVDQKLRGRGYGHSAIRLSSKELFRVSKVNTIYAYVKPENKNSVLAFLKAGFRDGGTTIIQGHRARVFTLAKAEKA